MEMDGEVGGTLGKATAGYGGIVRISQDTVWDTKGMVRHACVLKAFVVE